MEATNDKVGLEFSYEGPSVYKGSIISTITYELDASNENIVAFVSEQPRFLGFQHLPCVSISKLDGKYISRFPNIEGIRGFFCTVEVARSLKNISVQLVTKNKHEVIPLRFSLPFPFEAGQHYNITVYRKVGGNFHIRINKIFVEKSSIVYRGNATAVPSVWRAICIPLLVLLISYVAFSALSNYSPLN